LFYPGLALTLALAIVFGWLVERRARPGRIRLAALWNGLDGIAASLSIMLAALALVLLPWPFHPLAGRPPIGSPLAIWAPLEAAFLLPALPGLMASSPLAMRAASREAQMSVAGRVVVWLALGAALWGGAGWSLLALPGRLLAGVAAVLALPVVIGAGPFGAERSLSAAGAEDGLDEATTGLVRFARRTRGVALLAALLVASVPPAASIGLAAPLIPAGSFTVQPWIALLLIVALFTVVSLALRQIAAVLPRFPLPAALRWCWWRALPLAVAGVVYLAVVR
jgi:hypothetical protein